MYKWYVLFVKVLRAATPVINLVYKESDNYKIDLV